MHRRIPDENFKQMGYVCISMTIYCIKMTGYIYDNFDLSYLFKATYILTNFSEKKIKQPKRPCLICNTILLNRTYGTIYNINSTIPFLLTLKNTAFFICVFFLLFVLHFFVFSFRVSSALCAIKNHKVRC